MARKLVRLNDEQRKQMVYEWELGAYQNYKEASEAYGVSFNTAATIIKSSQAIKGSRAGELADYVKAKKEFVVNPTAVNARNRQLAKAVLPIQNLFDLDAIEKHTNGLVAKEIMDELQEQLIKSNILLVNAIANDNIRKNKKEVIIPKYGKVETKLEAQDLKHYIDIADKSLNALGLIDTTEKTQFQLQVNNKISADVEYKTVLPEVDENEEAIDIFDNGTEEEHKEAV